MILLLIPILVIYFLIFSPSLNLGFAGDDYMSLFDYLHNFGPNHISNLVDINFFLTQYGSPDTIFGIIYRIFGLNPTPFFTISFFLRLSAALSIYPSIKLITKSRLAAFTSILFFAITTTGIETTSWVFNMASYLALIFFNLFNFYYLKSHFESKRYLILSGLFFFLALIIQPIRMTGLPIYIFLTEIIYLFIYRDLNSIKKLLLGGIFFISIIVFIFSIGNTLSTNVTFAGSNFWERISSSWDQRLTGDNKGITKLLAEGNFKILLNPVTQIGIIIFPEYFVKKLVDINEMWSTKFLIKIYMIFFLLVWILKHLANIKNSSLVLFSTIGLGYLGSLYYLMNSKLLTLNQVEAFYLTTGGFFILLIIYLLLSIKTDKTKKFLIISAFSWMLASFIIPWIKTPDSLSISTHRYLISPALGLALVLGTVLSLSQSNRKQIMTFIIILPLILIHIFSSFNYINELEKDRNKDLTNRIRYVFPQLKQIQKNDKPLVFYFKADDPEMLYHTILFGFPAFISIHQNLDTVPPLVYTDSWSEVVSAYQDGKSVVRFRNPQTTVPIENFYSYYIKSDGSIIETTEQIRKDLTDL